MFKNAPFSGRHPILLSFGDNPDFFRRFAIDGIEQRGHNGIDYQLPVGTALQAVAHGTVLETGNEPDGYGQYVVTGHEWGQLLYAHLSNVMVATGTTLSSGQVIGYSGDSGSATVPQLHFGLRIHPFSIRDGWFGFTDPAPYLRRLTQPLGPIIGPHIVGGLDMDLLRTWQPRMVLVLDPNPDEMRRLKEACPNTTIIGRIFATDHEVSENISEDPGDAARWAHSKTMERMSPHVDYWQFANEVLQHINDLPLLAQFELERMALAEANGYKCAILGFSVGNPDLPENDRMACWEKVYPAIERAETNGHVIAIHQYGMPDLLGPDGLADWLILRLEHQVLMRLPYKKVKFAVTEYGIDGLIQGPSPSGWKHFSNAEEYASQLQRNGRYLERYMGRVLGYAVFTLGHYSPWGSYDILGAVAKSLAEQSDRGLWSEISDAGEMLGTTQGDRVTSPGVGGSTTQSGATDSSTSNPIPIPPVPVTPDPVAPEPVTPTDGDSELDSGSTPPPVTEGGSTENEQISSSLPTIVQRTSDGFHALNAQLRPITDRADIDLSSLKKGDVIYLIKDVFTTKNGSWEPSNDPHSIASWARQSYLKPFGAADWFDDAGADHHIFGAVLGLDGELIRNQELIFWSDGFSQLGNPAYAGYTRGRTKSGSGWMNQAIGPGSSFVPERGERGPWCWMPAGTSEVFEGGGLPANHHVSTFVVWQAVQLEESIQSPGTDNTGTGNSGNEQSSNDNNNQGGTDNQGGTIVTPPVEPPVVIEASPVEQRIGEWAGRLNVSVIPINERADANDILANEEIVYLLKDLFTTRDGSWEPSDKTGAIPAWAKTYLKPLGAADYFDDAGGDRHLFAAVIGLDGEFIKLKQIAFWSDGADKLGDASYDGYVYRETKDKSGWINIPIGPGSSFVPERDESGPWCWAPTGAADVVCGGGLPAKQHVSTFAVWQAVRKSDLVSTQSGNNQTDDESTQQAKETTTIFMPFIAGGGTRSAQSPQARGAQSIATPAQPVREDSPAPVEVDGSAQTAALAAIRNNAWIRTGVEHRDDSPFVAYARAHGLGMPATDEFTVDGFRVQGYSGAILYASESEPSVIQEMAW